MTIKFERRTFKCELRAKGDGDRKIVGYGAVFNKLSENLGGFREVIAPGAFDGVLNDDVRALFNHDRNVVLGRTKASTLRLLVDSEGLQYEIDPPDTQQARDLIVSMDRGDIDQSSFGFYIDEDKWEEDDDGRVVRTVLKLKRLFDVSPVTFPAYPDAPSTARDLEAAQDGLQTFLQARDTRAGEAARELQKAKNQLLARGIAVR